MNARDPLGNSLRLLRALAERQTTVAGVRELATSLGMQPSTVSRLLASLATEGLVSQDKRTGGYQLGLELLRLGRLASEKLDVRTLARPHMEELARLCGETVVLGLYDQVRTEMLRVEKLEGSQPLRYVIEMNQWTEIFRGASGLAILAFLPGDEQEAILAVAEQNRTEAEPWLARDLLRRDLAEIRVRGYACTHGRRLPGAAAIAAPIFDGNSRVMGDVIVTIPEVRFHQDDELRIAELVTATAFAITRDTGGVIPADLAASISSRS